MMPSKIMYQSVMLTPMPLLRIRVEIQADLVLA